MPVATRKQIKSSVLSTTSQIQAQIGDLVDDFINITMQEIGEPSWAFKKEIHHLWSWLKRKTSFTATSEDTVMERDVDKIAFLRQISSPLKLTYVPDELFYELLPYPTDTGNPRFYRLWEIGGTAAKLSAAATLKVVSSSTSDDATFEVVATGYVSGIIQTEVLTMNGTTSVSGSISFDAREIFVSKSADFTGTITVSDASDNVLVTIGPKEISPRFKVVSLYPIPSSITVYCEYYKPIKELTRDSEMPEFSPKWHHVVRIGTLAKVYQHLGKTEDFAVTNGLYARQVRAMVESDTNLPDYIEHLRRRNNFRNAGIRLHPSEDAIA